MEVALVAEMLDPLDGRLNVAAAARAVVRCSVRAPTVLAPAGAGKRVAGSRLIAGWPSRAATCALIGFS